MRRGNLEVLDIFDYEFDSLRFARKDSKMTFSASCSGSLDRINESPAQALPVTHMHNECRMGPAIILDFFGEGAIVSYKQDLEGPIT